MMLLSNAFVTHWKVISGCLLRARRHCKDPYFLILSKLGSVLISICNFVINRHLFYKTSFMVLLIWLIYWCHAKDIWRSCFTSSHFGPVDKGPQKCFTEHSLFMITNLLYIFFFFYNNTSLWGNQLEAKLLQWHAPKCCHNEKGSQWDC